jgi:hypothetical protein
MLYRIDLSRYVGSLGYLFGIASPRSRSSARDHQRVGKLTSKIRFGVICKSLEPDCCNSTVVSGSGFLYDQHMGVFQVGDTYHLVVGLVSTLVTVASGSSTHCS